MHAIKNALVTTTLVAVGYGVYVILANPAPDGGASATRDWGTVDSAAPSAAPESGQPWVEMNPPQLTIEAGIPTTTPPASVATAAPSTPSIAAPVSNPNPSVLQPSLVPVQGNPSESTPPLLTASTGETAEPTSPYVPSPSMAQVESSAPLQNNSGTGGAAEGAGPSPPGATSPLATSSASASPISPPPQAVATPASAHQIEPESGPPMDAGPSNGGTDPYVGAANAVTPTAATLASNGDPPADSQTAPTTEASLESAGSNAFNTAWQTADRQMQNGEMANALFTLSIWYQDPSLNPEQRARCVKKLDELAAEVIYSRHHHLQPAYIVRAGDTLEGVAEQFQVPMLFLARVNGIGPPYELAAGESIKVVQGPFRAEIDTRRREMTVFAGSYYAGRFPLELGQDASITTGRYEVASKMIDPSYVDPQTREQVAGGDPKNPYGRVWLGLRNETSPPEFRLGLHGSLEGATAQDLRGSIRLTSRDVDDVQAILSLGSPVIIR